MENVKYSNQVLRLFNNLLNEHMQCNYENFEFEHECYYHIDDLKLYVEALELLHELSIYKDKRDLEKREKEAQQGGQNE